MNRHDWGDVHFWLAVAVGAVVLVHLALHWNWICGFIRQHVGRGGTAANVSRWNHLYGVVTLLLIAGVVGGFLCLAQRSVAELPGGEHRGGPPWAGQRNR
jgi:hypothetical protein